MKNKLLTVLPILTALFLGLTLGLYLGRNPAGGSVTVSIPAQQQVVAATSAPIQTSPVTQTRVNINTADAGELSNLPGIGEVLAQRIVDYRNMNGRFTAVEQLTQVEGIGEGKLEAILEQITIGG